MLVFRLLLSIGGNLGKQIYCTSKQYYDFICFMESVYLANLTLKMMMAYNDGNIISRIKSSLIANTLFDSSGGTVTEAEQKQILEYIMERYANMRGTFFARHLKCKSGDILAKRVENQPTRTKVLHAAHCNQSCEFNKREQLFQRGQ